jgi:hypothetical protein
MWVTSGVRMWAASAGTTTAMTASAVWQCGQRWTPFADMSAFVTGPGTAFTAFGLVRTLRVPAFGVSGSARTACGTAFVGSFAGGWVRWCAARQRAEQNRRFGLRLVTLTRVPQVAHGRSVRTVIAVPGW